MKYVKILIITSIVFFIYKLNDDNKTNDKLPNKKDNLTIFIFIKNSDSLNNAASHLYDNIKRVCYKILCK